MADKRTKKPVNSLIEPVKSTVAPKKCNSGITKRRADLRLPVIGSNGKTRRSS